MTDEELWNAYTWADRCLRSNFVVTIDGHVAGADGLSGTLSSPEDRRIFHMLRAGCDAVLVGAGTVRDESYGPVEIRPQWQQFREQASGPALLIVSNSGNVPDIDGASVVRGSDVARAVEDYPRILCEGGPRLFTSLLEQGLVDELALTVAGQLGGSRVLVTGDVTRRAEVRHSHSADGNVFTLWTMS